MVAEPGNRFLYHTGLLMNDRQEDPKLNLLAYEVLLAAEAGFVHLRQRRSADGSGTDYWVVRTEEIAG